MKITLDRERIALFAFVIAVAVVHALVAAWTPLQADDWNHRIWAAEHHGAAAWLRAHYTFSEAIGYLLATCHTVHVLVTPAVVLALVTGLFTLAMRRLPSATWDDLLGLALVYTLIWIGQPHAGVTWFHTPSVALHVYGAAVAVWFLAPFRCGWQVPRAAWPLLAICGYCAATSSDAIATATVVAVGLAPWQRRERWRYVAAGGLLVGAIAGFSHPPLLEFARTAHRGFEPNLIVLRVPVEAGGKLIALVAALVVIDALLGTFGKPRAAAAARPEPTARWLLGGLALAVWCVLGPRFYEATFLPATCVLVIGALPWLSWLATATIQRAILIAIAGAVCAGVWIMSLATYHRFGEEGAARWDILSHTPPGQVAFVPPYSQILADFWFDGEDLEKARVRQLVAIDIFGLRDIVIDPTFRRLELDPHIDVKLEVTGASDAQLRAAELPAFWGTVPSVAREQFDLFVRRLRTVAGKQITARLVVTNVPFANANKRPLLLAWADSQRTVIPRTTVSPVDENNEYTFRIYGNDVRRFNEAWIVENGATSSTPYRDGAPHFRPTRAALEVVVVCNAELCIVDDAFIPRF